ncbi:MAG: caspase family protein [Candidatus Marithrix sp.]
MGANTGELTKANSDAQSFANAIQKRFNIDINKLCIIADVEKWQFKQALTRLEELVQPQDKVFIYFSGHSTTKSDYDNDEIDCYDEAFVTNSNILLTDDDFVSLVNAINTDDIITFIDSCFASGMFRGEENCSAKSKFWLWPNLKNTEDKLPSKHCPT